MSNPFAAAGLATGYATARPPLHQLITARISPGRTFRRALDIGCGAGLSTAPLLARSSLAIGLEPYQGMARIAPHVAPGARFLCARAEALPFPARSFDLLTAAGSLNYADLDRFFPEAARVLTPDGLLAVYDFSPPLLDGWLHEFYRRYPPPVSEARELNPEILAAIHPLFELASAERFQIPLTLDQDFYLNYMLTETNVGHAVRNGTPHEEIAAWCRRSLHEVFEGNPRQVHFPGYIASLKLNSKECS